MLRKLAPMLSLVLMAVLAIAPAATAQDKVEGTMDLTWNDCYTGPGEAVPDWIGTIDIGGDVYDMLFFNVGTGRPPNHALEAPHGSFNEIWAIYDGLELVQDPACAAEGFEGDAVQKLDGELVLWGHDAGTGNDETATYEMSGTVMEAFGDFDGLAGSTVSMSGTFFLDPDEVLKAPGAFAIS